jgi:hypothetical protein
LSLRLLLADRKLLSELRIGVDAAMSGGVTARVTRIARVIYRSGFDPALFFCWIFSDPGLSLCIYFDRMSKIAHSVYQYAGPSLLVGSVAFETVVGSNQKLKISFH